MRTTIQCVQNVPVPRTPNWCTLQYQSQRKRQAVCDPHSELLVVSRRKQHCRQYLCGLKLDIPTATRTTTHIHCMSCYVCHCRALITLCQNIEYCKRSPVLSCVHNDVHCKLANMFMKTNTTSLQHVPFWNVITGPNAPTKRSDHVSASWENACPPHATPT